MGVILRKKLNESLPLRQRTDVDSIIEKLKILFAEEFLAWYQYYIVSKFMSGHERPSIEKTFEEFADDELNDHGNKLLKRISELGGDISNISNPNNLMNIAKCEYIAPCKPYNTLNLLEDNIKAEECAIKHYMELADLTKDCDYTTYNMAMEILADEEDHYRELQDYYVDITGHEFDNEYTEDVTNNDIVYVVKDIYTKEETF